MFIVYSIYIIITKHMNFLYLSNSPWSEEHTVEELKELEYTQIDEAAGGNGKGNGNTTDVPINGGVYVVLFFVLIWGLYRSKKWKQSLI